MGRMTFELFNTSFASEGILEGWVEVGGHRAGTLIYYEVDYIQDFPHPLQWHTGRRVTGLSTTQILSPVLTRSGSVASQKKRGELDRDD